jgi:kynurenine formamidase
MPFARSAVSLGALLLLAACSIQADKDPFAGEWVDLTHALGEDSVFWPTAEDYRHEEVMHGRTDGGWFYSSYNIHLSEHGGTHLDAPIHFAEGRQTVDEIPLDRLIGLAAVIDVSERALAERDYRISREDLLLWEEQHGKLPEGAILLIRTGYDRYWPDRIAYLGTDLRGAQGVANLHFPGLSEELARFLVEERSIAAVGIDTASLDYGQSQDFIAHRILLGANIPGFENVANLGELPPTGARVVALPTKIRGGSGGPLRIVALVPSGES